MTSISEVDVAARLTAADDATVDLFDHGFDCFCDVVEGGRSRARPAGLRRLLHRRHRGCLPRLQRLSWYCRWRFAQRHPRCSVYCRSRSIPNGVLDGVVGTGSLQRARRPPPPWPPADTHSVGDRVGVDLGVRRRCEVSAAGILDGGVIKQFLGAVFNPIFGQGGSDQTGGVAATCPPAPAVTRCSRDSRDVGVIRSVDGQRSRGGDAGFVQQSSFDRVLDRIERTTSRTCQGPSSALTTGERSTKANRDGQNLGSGCCSETDGPRGAYCSGFDRGFGGILDVVEGGRSCARPSRLRPPCPPAGTSRDCLPPATAIILVSSLAVCVMTPTLVILLVRIDA